jgi:hypothetical protein
MNAEKILERLEEFFGNSEGGISKYAFNNFLDSELGLGEIKEVEQVGGEGEGDNWWVVKHFVEYDVYIKTNAFYSSYNGTDFYYGFGEEVKPKEKSIVVYE